MADFQCDPLQRSADDGQRGQIMRMPVALDYLRGDLGGAQSQLDANFVFDRRSEMREGSHCTGKFSHSHGRGGGTEAFGVALVLAPPVGDLEAEGGRLRMDAMGTTYHYSIAKFVGTALQNLGKLQQSGLNLRRGLGHKQGLRGIDHVVGGESI